MIHFLLCQNKMGRTRLAQYYTNYTAEERAVLEKEIIRTVATRNMK